MPKIGYRVDNCSKTIIRNVYNYLKNTFPTKTELEIKIVLSRATGVSLATIYKLDLNDIHPEVEVIAKKPKKAKISYAKPKIAKPPVEVKRVEKNILDIPTEIAVPKEKIVIYPHQVQSSNNYNRPVSISSKVTKYVLYRPNVVSSDTLVRNLSQPLVDNSSFVYTPEIKQEPNYDSITNSSAPYANYDFSGVMKEEPSDYEAQSDGPLTSSTVDIKQENNLDFEDLIDSCEIKNES